MIDNDQSTIIEAPEVHKFIPTHSPTAKPTTESRGNSHLNFDTFDGHVRVNFIEIEPNFQDIIFTLSTVSLITQKQFWGHLKNSHFWGPEEILLVSHLGHVVGYDWGTPVASYS
jgi:hypothetical protein